MRKASAEKTVQHYVDRYDMASFLNDDLLSNLQLFHFPAYSNIYIENDEQHFLYFLVEGQLQCNHYHPNGKVAVFALSEPFTAIGDFEILSDETVFSNVIATQDSVMLGIDSAYVSRYGADDPRFLRFLIDQLREKMYRTSLLQKGQGLPVLNRLVVYMLGQPAGDEADVVMLPNKEELASMLGTTPRHLNRVLKQLVESGNISAGYPLVRILDRPALQHLGH